MNYFHIPNAIRLIKHFLKNMIMFSIEAQQNSLYQYFSFPKESNDHFFQIVQILLERSKTSFCGIYHSLTQRKSKFEIQPVFEKSVSHSD